MDVDHFRTYTNKLYSRFIKIRGNPVEIASGFAIGLFIGLTPFFGVHTVISIFLAALLKTNKIAAVVGVQITNIFTAPFFYTITYWVGSRALGSDHISSLNLQFTLNTILELFKSAPMILWALILGGIIVGLPVSLVAYIITYFLCKRFQHI